ncbi:hypothetical protein PHLGIDRAFT_387178 [Phlebiopsis gigantea 11061_1 CR5-6]|uniref:DUF6534 domain-containing protein n=1 Tax=Phlebiopsis gigantea (strain 11061_1 CR5-6) TaxID=745531 RepID=A0A0C3S068_PHLG1|nr:hypothetical protein PHLGIDRAFT_387178 [Phlebiopsis gigantea 11061_1 CR5-6]
MDAGDADLPIGLSPTFGATLIGCLGMMGLYGVTSLQTFIYFSFYPDDRLSLKSLVYLIWVLDTLHIIFICHAMYYYLILNYANPSALLTGTWSLWSSMIVNCVIGCIVQGFFTARLYAVTHRVTRRWLIPTIVILVLLHLAFGLETGIWGLILQGFTDFKAKIWSSALPFAVFAVASDIVIALSLCINLWKTKAYFMTTSNVLNRLIIFAINRCLLTASIAVLEIVLFAVFPSALWYLGLDFVIGKLYANSLLATLNTRYSARARGSTVGLDSDPDRGRAAYRLGRGENGGGLVLSTVVQSMQDDASFEIEQQKT